MMLEQLKKGQTFKFAPRQTVRTMSWIGGETMDTNVYGSSVKVYVKRVNAASLRGLFTFRDKDKDSIEVSLRFKDNENVQVEVI